MIVARFMASAIICRIIAAYELAGMTAAEETRATGQQKANSGDLEEGKYATCKKSDDPARGRNTFSTGSKISPAQTIKDQVPVRSRVYY